MLSRANKKQQISELSSSFQKAKSSFLVHCIGLNVEEMTHLRKQLKQNKADIKVIRNTLAHLVLGEHSKLKSAYESQLDGPNAFVLAYGDVTQVAKVMEEMHTQNEIFKIKCGVLDGNLVTEKEIKVLANLPSLDVLRATLLSVLSTPLTQFVRTLKAVPESCVRVLKAQKEKTN